MSPICRICNQGQIHLRDKIIRIGERRYAHTRCLRQAMTTEKSKTRANQDVERKVSVPAARKPQTHTFPALTAEQIEQARRNRVLLKDEFFEERRRRMEGL